MLKNNSKNSNSGGRKYGYNPRSTSNAREIPEKKSRAGTSTFIYRPADKLQSKVEYKVHHSTTNSLKSSVTAKSGATGSTKLRRSIGSKNQKGGRNSQLLQARYNQNETSDTGMETLKFSKQTLSRVGDAGRFARSGADAVKNGRKNFDKKVKSRLSQNSAKRAAKGIKSPVTITMSRGAIKRVREIKRVRDGKNINSGKIKTASHDRPKVKTAALQKTSAPVQIKTANPAKPKVTHHDIKTTEKLKHLRSKTYVQKSTVRVLGSGKLAKVKRPNLEKLNGSKLVHPVEHTRQLKTVKRQMKSAPDIKIGLSGNGQRFKLKRSSSFRAKRQWRYLRAAAFISAGATIKYVAKMPFKGLGDRFLNQKINTHDISDSGIESLKIVGQSLGIARDSIRTVRTGVKVVKAPFKAGIRTIKTVRRVPKTVTRTVKTVKRSVKTAQASAKMAAKTAQATARLSVRAAQVAARALSALATALAPAAPYILAAAGVILIVVIIVNAVGTIISGFAGLAQSGLGWLNDKNSTDIMMKQEYIRMCEVFDSVYESVTGTDIPDAVEDGLAAKQADLSADFGDPDMFELGSEVYLEQSTKFTEEDKYAFFAAMLVLKQSLHPEEDITLNYLTDEDIRLFLIASHDVPSDPTYFDYTYSANQYTKAEYEALQTEAASKKADIDYYENALKAPGLSDVDKTYLTTKLKEARAKYDDVINKPGTGAAQSPAVAAQRAGIKAQIQSLQNQNAALAATDMTGLPPQAIDSIYAQIAANNATINALTASLDDLKIVINGTVHIKLKGVEAIYEWLGLELVIPPITPEQVAKNEENKAKQEGIKSWVEGNTEMLKEFIASVKLPPPGPAGFSLRLPITSRMSVTEIAALYAAEE